MRVRGTPSKTVSGAALGVATPESARQNTKFANKGDELYTNILSVDNKYNIDLL